jgi:glycosyltransferase involved in cell wall biosynthesis
MDLSKVWLVIAAFNEGGMITDVIKHAIATFPNVVVVDDGSTDTTATLACEAGSTVICHPINLGQGAAIQTGIDFALISGADIIVTFDADGQHRIEDALTLARAIDQNEADIVCGSRFLGVESTTMPATKRLTLKLAAIFTRLSSGVPVTDAHNGLRAISRSAAQKIRITQNRMAHASEIISQVKSLKLRYKEYPVQILYTDYSIAKGQKISNAINILIDLLFGRISK